MRLNVLCADDHLTHVELHGRLDIAGVNEIQDQFVYQTAGRRRSTLVDLSHVTFIASLGMGLLVSAAKALQRSGAKMVLVRPPDLVRKALEAAGIHFVIPIAEEAERALQLLG
jgi:anti-sigma B factor antagonist